MSVTPTSTVVGIFRDRSMAEQAMESLQNAGFGHDQIRYAVPGTSSSFFEDLKSLFSSRQDAGRDTIANDLTNMDLSDEEARYYTDEYNNGNTILAVKAPGREQEALSMLYQYGAYNARRESNTSQETAGTMPSTQHEQAEQAQQTATHADDSITPSGQQYSDPYWVARPQMQPQPDAEYPYQERQPEATTSSPETQSHEQPEKQEIADRTTQPFTSRSDTEAHHLHSEDVSYAQESDQQISSTSTTTAEHEPAAQHRQAEKVTHEQETHPETGTPEDKDELQLLQEQIQTLQLQLQEARAQLQVEKDREAEAQKMREREQQLTNARRQLQEMQSELQSTLAELQEMRTRQHSAL